MTQLTTGTCYFGDSKQNLPFDQYLAINLYQVVFLFRPQTRKSLQNLNIFAVGRLPFGYLHAIPFVNKQRPLLLNSTFVEQMQPSTLILSHKYNQHWKCHEIMKAKVSLHNTAKK